MRTALIGLCMAAAAAVSNPAMAQLSFGYSGPGVSIGVNLPVYPDLVPVPGYPVYYAPNAPTNYFFYDGLYWVFDGTNWYESAWYNGPWSLMDPYSVPVFLLRVPVRYYHHAPSYFRAWAYDSAPRWGDHWGHSWEQRRAGWDRWNRASVPAAAPLPTYQRQYSGSRYPSQAQQAAIQTRNYNYQPRDAVVRQRYQQQRTQVTQAPAQPQATAPSVAREQRATQNFQNAQERQREQQAQQQRQERVQQSQVQQQQRQERVQAAQVQQQQRQERVQQSQVQQQQRQERVQQAQVQQQQRQERVQQAQVQQQQRQERVQQAQVQQQQRQERVQQAQVQRQEAQPQRGERPQQQGAREARGHDKGQEPERDNGQHSGG